MSASLDSDQHLSHHDTPSPITLRDLVDALDRTRRAIESVRDAIARLTVPDASDVRDPLLDIDALAARLGVSTRWVQRHLRPSLRASARGKGWYRLSDVETQLAVMEEPRTSRPRTKARSSPTTKSTPTKPVLRRAEAPDAIAEMETKLRASLSNPTRRTR